MLCEVTIPAGNDLHRCVSNALFKAIKAVATATVGSTPSATYYPAYNSTAGGTEVITQVIDNSIAGSWLVNESYDNVPPDGSILSTVYCQNLCIYQPSGKTNSNYEYSFVQITNVPTSAATAASAMCDIWRFGHASLALMNPANTTAGWNFQDYVTSHTSRRSTSNVGIWPTGAADFIATSNPFFAGTAVLRKYIISAGPGYLTVVQVGREFGTQNYGSAHCAGYFHFGKRTYHAWEDNLDTTPYWVALWQNAKGTNVQSSYGGFWTKWGLLNSSTSAITETTSSSWCNNQLTTSQHNRDPVTNSWTVNNTTSWQYEQDYYRQYSYYGGQTLSATITYPSNLNTILTTTSSGSISRTIYTTTTYNAQTPFYVASDADWNIGANVSVKPVIDPVTSTIVPPVKPIMIEAVTTAAFLSNTDNYMLNLYHGGQWTATQIRDYITPYALYEINGEKFYPVSLIGTNSDAGPGDLMWVKA